MKKPILLLINCPCGRWFDATGHRKSFACCPSCASAIDLEPDPNACPDPNAELRNVVTDCEPKPLKAIDREAHRQISELRQELGETRRLLDDARREGLRLPTRDKIAEVVYEHVGQMRNHIDVLEKRILLLEETSRKLAKQVFP